MTPAEETELAPLLDPKGLALLREWGVEPLVKKMVELFLRNSEERLALGREGLEAGDPRLVERAAHSVKSGAGNVGADRLRDLATRIEGAAEAGELAPAEGLWPRFESVARGTLGELVDVFAQTPPRGEFVILIERPAPVRASRQELEEALEMALQESSLSAAVAQVSADLGLPRREVYQAALTVRDAR